MRMIGEIIYKGEERKRERKQRFAFPKEKGK